MKCSVTNGVMTIEIEDPYLVEDVLDRVEVRAREAMDSYQYEFCLKYLSDVIALTKGLERMRSNK